MAISRYRHILLPTLPQSNDFTSPMSVRVKKNIPHRDRQGHSRYLQNEFERAWKEGEVDQTAVTHSVRHGVYIEFKSDPGADLVTKSLEDMKSKKVRLLNVRTERSYVQIKDTGEQEKATITFATVYVANEKKDHFLKKIQDYANKETLSGRPKNADLINSIAGLRKALAIDSFWLDEKSLIPKDTPEWCEVWLSTSSEEKVTRFNNLLTSLKIRSKSGIIRFPERVVKMILANRGNLEQLSELSDDIAEYRRAKITAEFWTGLQNKEQAEWAKDLLGRLHVDISSNVSICILDTGINNGHPLISPVLKNRDCHTIDPSWGTHDHDKHGTLMAGSAIYGNLLQALAGNDVVNINHHLESVKIYPVPPNHTRPEFWGFITSQGVSRAEIQSPEKLRIVCMAITSDDTRDRGRPSSWSGQLDQIIAGTDDNKKRLLIVSAGNCDSENWGQYPDAQLTDSIHDPAQAWNALTVGAFTKMVDIQEPTFSNYDPLAPKNGLSPFTTTSICWEDNKWPCKPEIVLEGGNLARDSDNFISECDDLSLLSTYYNPQISHFHPFNMTSAATAQAAWMAAKIQALYPNYWPETIRALLVHSAEWPEELLQQFNIGNTKFDMKRLLRICGYGVPNLERAMYSAANSLTLISQSEIQPFDKKRDEDGNPKPGYKTKEMHLYKLPWPKDVLESLPDKTDIKMRITLSYFIEPGPGEIGWRDRYRYASHALRFDLISPTETSDQFIKRINKAARDEDEGHPGTGSASGYWKIGQARNTGSIHSDIWQGSAAELAASNIIAISPRIGWWRERAYLGKWSNKTRYALVVSITTPEENVDIYTPVANQVGIPIEIRT